MSALGPTLPVWSLPTVVFVLAAAIAFATGTSFGTMAVLVPLAMSISAEWGLLIGGISAGTIGFFLGRKAPSVET